MTIKYKTKSYLQMIGRIPLARELEVVKAKDAKRNRVESPKPNDRSKKIKVGMLSAEGEQLNIADDVNLID
jgi:hypothetical protein